MTRKNLVVIAMIGSAILLLAAFAFQHIGGLAPCKMCIWQRWPHGAAIVIGLTALALPVALLLLAGALAAALTGAIGVYHMGVERGWWKGPDTCTSGDISNLSSDDLLNQIMSAPLVRCDDVAWQMLGLSMAGWNAVISFGLAVIWLMALRMPRS